MIYLLTAIGLTPGDSSTVHIYTQTVHRTTQLIIIIIIIIIIYLTENGLSPGGSGYNVCT